MTPLRQRFTQDLQVRNHSPRTIEGYIGSVARFARYFGRSPEDLGPEEIRSYQLHLIDRKLSWSTYNGSVCALRFLYSVTLRRDWAVERIPYARESRKLPVVLSQEEVLRFLSAVDKPKHRMALTTQYAAGLRVSEVVRLRAEDIDSPRMVIHVLGKGNKQRMVPLSKILLQQLRAYWRQERRYCVPGSIGSITAATTGRCRGSGSIGCWGVTRCRNLGSLMPRNHAANPCPEEPGASTRTPGSVGAPGGQPPGATRPFRTHMATL